ncbi:MAG: LytTR family DNA-binding domain-containing protein [Pseudomonadota bacterium]
MTKNTLDIDDRPKLLEPGNWWRVYFLGWVPVGLSYLIILGLFIDITGWTLVTTWTANVIFPSFAGLGVAWGVLNLLVHQPLKLQLAIHTAGAIIFAMLWAMVAFRLLQLFSGLLTGDWSPPNWPSAAVAWQLFQGLAIYFTIVSATYAYWALTLLFRGQVSETPQSDPAPARIYAKTSEGLMPLNIDDVCAAKTIDSVTYIFVDGKKLESRMTLAELEAALPSDHFLRVHRSIIVNLNQIHSIEPAGNGRRTLHLKSGMSFETSRAGATALKSRLAFV